MFLYMGEGGGGCKEIPEKAKHIISGQAKHFKMTQTDPPPFKFGPFQPSVIVPPTLLFTL